MLDAAVGYDSLFGVLNNECLPFSPMNQLAFPIYSLYMWCKTAAKYSANPPQLIKHSCLPLCSVAQVSVTPISSRKDPLLPPGIFLNCAGNVTTSTSGTSHFSDVFIHEIATDCWCFCLPSSQEADDTVVQEKIPGEAGCCCWAVMVVPRSVN